MIHFCPSIRACMSIGELIKIKKANFRFQRETVRLYYRKSWRFALSDLALGFATLFFNPYRICRKKGPPTERPLPPPCIGSPHSARSPPMTAISSSDQVGEKGVFGSLNLSGAAPSALRKFPCFFIFLEEPRPFLVLSVSHSLKPIWRRPIFQGRAASTFTALAWAKRSSPALLKKWRACPKVQKSFLSAPQCPKRPTLPSEGRSPFLFLGERRKGICM